MDTKTLALNPTRYASQEYVVSASGGLPAEALEALESCGLEESRGAEDAQISMHLRLRVYTREERLARKADRADQAVASKAAAAANQAAKGKGGDAVVAAT